MKEPTTLHRVLRCLLRLHLPLGSWGKTAKEPVYVALGVKLNGSREILGFWIFGAEGESSHNWETILKELWERGVRRVELFISDDLPGIEEAIRRIFPQATWQLCVVHAVRDALAKVR